MRGTSPERAQNFGIEMKCAKVLGTTVWQVHGHGDKESSGSLGGPLASPPPFPQHFL